MYFGVPVDSKLYSSFKITETPQNVYDVNWVGLRYDGKNTAISLRHSHVTAASVPKSQSWLLEYIEEALSTHSDAITKLAEEAKATAARYVLSYLAIASYAKLEAQS